MDIGDVDVAPFAIVVSFEIEFVSPDGRERFQFYVCLKGERAVFKITTTELTRTQYYCYLAASLFITIGSIIYIII